MTGPSASGHRSSATGIVLLPRDPADGAHESLAHMFAAYEREDDQSDERQGQDGRRVEPERGHVPPCPAGRVSEVSRGTHTVG